MNCHFRMIRTAAIAFSAVFVVCLLSQDASAQGCRYGGYGGNAYGSYYGGNVYGSSINVGYYNRSTGLSVGFYRGNPGYAGYGRIPRHTWHDTSHYDYVPGRYVRHGNHLHRIPGHYQLHRTGHWHHNHR